MKQHMILTMTFGLLLLANGLVAADKVVIYGHLSYLQEGVSVERGDGMKVEKVMLNLPMAAGDTVATTDRARCEVQGDNGTIMRLDFNTRIRFETVLAASLTSNRWITTVRLLQGNLYIINNIYKREMMQVLTDQAAIKLKSNSKSLVYVNAENGTQLRVISGRVQVMYGADPKSLRTDTLVRGEEATITPGNVLLFGSVKDADFFLWNVGMNRNFDEMHRGLNKLPKPILSYPRALVDWAENWSNTYGQWIYNDLFGYVWHPYDERWANISYSPFTNFEWVTIGNTLYMVPQEPWGWIPMYLGTWNWDPNHGWIWIPGDAFHYNQLRFYDQYFFPYSQFLPMYAYYRYGFWTLSDWYYYPGFFYYSNYYGYPISHPEKNEPLFSISKNWLKNPKAIPSDVLKLMSKIVRLSPAEREKILPSGNRPARPFFYFTEAPRSILAAASALPMKKAKETGQRDAKVGQGRNWNPDSRWSLRSGLEIRLDRRTHEYCCPRLGITASLLNTSSAKMQFRGLSSDASGKIHGGWSSSGSDFSGSHSGSGESSSSSSSSSHSSGEHSSSGSQGGSGTKKD